MLVYTVLATDDFNRANALNLGGNWTARSGGIHVNTNQARPASVDETGHEAYTGITWPAWQWGQVTVVNATGIAAGADNGVGVILNDQGTSGDFYYAQMHGTTLLIKQCNGGFSDSSTLTSKAFTPQANDILRFESKPVAGGVELSVYITRGGVTTLELGPVTNSLHSGGDVGVITRVAAADVVNDGLLDDFQGGEIVDTNLARGGGFGAYGELPWGAQDEAAGGGSEDIAADSGSYAITGSPANLKKGYKIQAESGSYAISGTAASLEKGYKLIAESGSYVLTGAAASLRAARKLAIDAGSYSITGIDATLSRGRTITAESGSYAITGQDAGLRAARKLALDSGSYAITGTAAGLFKGRTLVAESGSYSITGMDATLLAGRKIAANGGSYAITGQTVALKAGRLLMALAGSYALTGTALTLKAARKVIADSGQYQITGQAVGLFKGRTLVAEPGSYTITGSQVTFMRNYRLMAESGSYAIQGQDVGVETSARRRSSGAAQQEHLARAAWLTEFQDEDDIISML